MKFVWNNLEFFKLGFNQEREIVEELMIGGSYDLSEYIEKHIPNQKIEQLAFALTIFSFVYMFNIGKYHGRQDASTEEILDNFIYNLSLCLR